jgi:hypothetical protein
LKFVGSWVRRFKVTVIWLQGYSFFDRRLRRRLFILNSFRIQIHHRVEAIITESPEWGSTGAVNRARPSRGENHIYTIKDSMDDLYAAGIEV